MKKILAYIIAIITLMISSIPAIASAANMYVTLNDGPNQKVNVRNSASTSGSIVATLLHGSQVSKLGTQGNWIRVNFYDFEQLQNVTGFIRSDYLSSSIPTSCYWIQRYSSTAHQLRDSYRDGCKELQTDLNRYAKRVGDVQNDWYPLTADGYCGEKTVKAIKHFQFDMNLNDDGIAGNQTKEALYKYMKRYNLL